jgi:hypothetical protein
MHTQIKTRKKNVTATTIFKLLIVHVFGNEQTIIAFPKELKAEWEIFVAFQSRIICLLVC